MTNWRADAQCLDEDPELFFPPGKGVQLQSQIRAAKKVCAACPVRAECLDFALGNQLNHGVWGGLTEDERKTLRRARPGTGRPGAPASAGAVRPTTAGVGA